MTIPFDPASVAPASPAVIDRSFADGVALAVALARSVGNELRAAIARRGSARLALSGGDTPRRFLAALAREPLDWARVLVLPVDERWVAPTHARSNERLLRETLLQGEGAGARLLSLHRPVAAPEAALHPVLAQVAAQALPLDVAVLGMGVDGHVASLFPDLVRRDIALAPYGRAPVLAVRSAHAPEPRMTLTLSALLSAPALYLHLEGDAKRRVFDAAVADPHSALPVRALLAQAPVPTRLFWCPTTRPMLVTTAGAAVGAR